MLAGHEHCTQCSQSPHVLTAITISILQIRKNNVFLTYLEEVNDGHNIQMVPVYRGPALYQVSYMRTGRN